MDEFNVDIIVKNEHSSEEKTEHKISAKIKRDSRWREFWTKIAEKDEGDESELTFFKKAQDGEEHKVGKDDLILEPKDCEDYLDQIFIHLTTRINHFFRLELIINQPINKNWARRHHSAVDSENELINNFLVFWVHQDDSFEVLHQFLDRYRDRFVWEEGENFEKMKIFFTGPDGSVRRCGFNPTFRQECIFRPEQEEDPKLFLADCEDENFFEMEIAPKLAEEKPPKLVERDNPNTTSEGKFGMRRTPNKDEKMVNIKISDRVRETLLPLEISLTKDLSNDFYTVGEQIFCMAKQFFNIRDEHIGFYYKNTWLDPETNIWDIFTDEYVHLEIYNVKNFEVQIIVGAFKRNLIISQAAPLRTLFRNLELREESFYLVAMEKNSKTYCDLGLTVGLSGISDNKRIHYLEVVPRNLGKLENIKVFWTVKDERSGDFSFEVNRFETISYSLQPEIKKQGYDLYSVGTALNTKLKLELAQNNKEISVSKRWEEYLTPGQEYLRFELDLRED